MQFPNKRAVILRVVGALVPAFAANAGAQEGGKLVDFSHEIVPVLKERCGECHLGEKKKGSFSMNTRAELLAGSENGEVLEVGKGAGSYLIELLTTDDKDIQMPPKGDRVPAAEVALLTKWIDEKVGWEEGFTFGEAGWEPPLKPREVELPPITDGRSNPVDRILDADLATHEIKRPGGIGDAVFMRRLFLDVIGVLPTPEELNAFLADGSKDKRTKLIEMVLNRDVDYAEHWLTFWNDLLRNDYAGTGFIDGGRKPITGWLYRSLVENKPFDQFVRELIAPTEESEGFIRGIQWRGNVNASQTRNVQFAQNLSQVFLGINMKCASCHDSFIDRWKLEDAYKLAAIYATEPVEIHRCDKPTGDLAQAAWIFPELGEVDPEAAQPERLKQLAALMTHPENGRFTRTIVNRIWHRLMGRGIVHPVDAMHTEPWNEDLLDVLAVHLRDSDFDLKETIRLIASSEAYQSEMAPTPDEAAAEDYVYRGPIARRLTAEQFIDAVWQITGTAPGKPAVDLLRMKVEPGKYEDIALTGKWIWANHGQVPAAGESITLRKVFELDRKPVRADAVVTVDNGYTLFVNGRKLRDDNDWMTVETVSVEGALKPGKNEIMIVAKNAGNGPNAASAYFELRAKLENPAGKEAKELRIATDDSWQWTKRQPDARGAWKKPVPENEWLPVEVLKGDIWAGQANPQMRAGLAQVDGERPPLVRASLVKSDLLMRSLGRPNREQVVTVRPEQLTTLQAIDLANGGILAKLLSQGAGKLNAQFAGQKPEVAMTWLFETGMSRKPTDQERAILSEMMGGELSPQGTEDLLWSVLMLPEFQLVR